MKNALPLILLLSLAGACQKDQEILKDVPVEESEPSSDVSEVAAPSAKTTDVLSFAEGNEWVYDLKATQVTPEGSGERGGEFKMVVQKVKAVDGHSVATIRVTDPSRKAAMTWSIGEDGLFQTVGADGNNKDVTFDPPLLLVPATLRAGEKGDWKGTGARLDGTRGAFEAAVQVIGKEEVDTLEGRMEAWSVESVAVWTEKDQQYRARTTTWWSPKVGLVRMIRELDTPKYGLKTVMRLKSHKVKQ